MYVKKSDLKNIIREILKEVTQQDIRSKYPQRKSAWSSKWDPNLKMMTLDNLMALKKKSAGIIRSLQQKNNIENHDEIQREIILYQMYNSEIKRRLAYINKPVVKEDHGLGYSHNVSFDDYQKERDPLNDPLLTGKINEAEYKFRDFPWAGMSSGFEVPTDVYYGSIYLGTIISKPEGYVIELIDTPEGKKTIEFRNSSGQKRGQIAFKTKEIAAKILHIYWKKQRTT